MSDLEEREKRRRLSKQVWASLATAPIVDLDMVAALRILLSVFHSRVLPKVHTYFHVHLIDCAAWIFPNSYAETVNRTHVSIVAPDRDL